MGKEIVRAERKAARRRRGGIGNWGELEGGGRWTHLGGGGRV